CSRGGPSRRRGRFSPGRKSLAGSPAESGRSGGRSDDGRDRYHPPERASTGCAAQGLRGRRSAEVKNRLAKQGGNAGYGPVPGRDGFLFFVRPLLRDLRRKERW